MRRKDDRYDAFCGIEQQHRYGALRAERAQRVHRADVARAVLAQIGAVGEPSNEIAERNRADQKRSNRHQHDEPEDLDEPDDFDRGHASRASFSRRGRNSSVTARPRNRTPGESYSPRNACTRAARVRIVAGEDEERRMRRRLRCVVDLEEFTADGGRGMGQHGVADQRVQLRGLDAAVEIFGDAVHDRHQTTQAPFGFSREKRDRCKARERDQIVDHAGKFVLAELALLLAREIPFVSNDDEPFAFLDSQAREAPVLRGNADHRIKDEQRDITAGDGFKRTQRSVVFDRAVRLGFLAHARCVDQPNRAVVPVEQRVDRVARRSGNLGYDGALFAEEGIEQRTLADIGTADDRKREFIAEHGIGRVGRK